MPYSKRQRRDDVVAGGLATGSLASLAGAEYARRGLKSSVKETHLPNRHGGTNRVVSQFDRWQGQTIPEKMLTSNRDWQEVSRYTDPKGWTRKHYEPLRHGGAGWQQTSVESPNWGYRKYTISSQAARRAAKAKKILPGAAAGLGAGALYFAARNRLRNAPIASEDDVSGRSRGYRSNTLDERRARHREEIWDPNRRY